MKTRMNIYLSNTTLHIVHRVQEERGVSFSAAIGILAESYKKTHSQDALVEQITERVIEKIQGKSA